MSYAAARFAAASVPPSASVTYATATFTLGAGATVLGDSKFFTTAVGTVSAGAGVVGVGGGGIQTITATFTLVAGATTDWVSSSAPSGAVGTVSAGASVAGQASAIKSSIGGIEAGARTSFKTLWGAVRSGNGDIAAGATVYGAARPAAASWPNLQGGAIVSGAGRSIAASQGACHAGASADFGIDFLRSASFSVTAGAYGYFNSETIQDPDIYRQRFADLIYVRAKTNRIEVRT